MQLGLTNEASLQKLVDSAHRIAHKAATNAVEGGFHNTDGRSVAVGLMAAALITAAATSAKLENILING